MSLQYVQHKSPWNASTILQQWTKYIAIALYLYKHSLTHNAHTSEGRTKKKSVSISARSAVRSYTHEISSGKNIMKRNYRQLVTSFNRNALSHFYENRSAAIQ